MEERDNGELHQVDCYCSRRGVRAGPAHTTHAGLQRAKSEGKTLGRPLALSPEQRRQVLQRLAAGEAVAAVARAIGTSRQTIMRARDAEAV